MECPECKSTHIRKNGNRRGKQHPFSLFPQEVYSQLAFLADRDTYRNYCVEKRINHISQSIEKYQPKAVVFYGKGYEYYWKKITNVEFLPTKDGFLVGSNSQTIFVIAKHPVALGTSNEYFHNIGRLIAPKSPKSSKSPKSPKKF